MQSVPNRAREVSEVSEAGVEVNVGAMHIEGMGLHIGGGGVGNATKPVDYGEAGDH